MEIGSGRTTLAASHSRTLICAVGLFVVLAVVRIGVAEPAWGEYAGNPIVGQAAAGPKAYYPTALYDDASFSGHDAGYASKYKMWFDSTPTAKLATSDDGVTWTVRGDVSMSSVAHPLVEYYATGFTGANSGTNPTAATMYYRLWYWPATITYTAADIRYAESADGLTWYNSQPVQNGAVPIITGPGGSDWNRGSYGPADVLHNPGATNTGTDWTFTMYYDGTTGGEERIGLAFSSDGITWTGYDANTDGKADPVFQGTFVAGDWDRNYVSRATIIRNAANDYEMWYSGGDGTMQSGIGYAKSADGISWTRQGVIFHKDDGVAWRSVRTYCPMVIRQGDDYRMWFTGVASSLYSIGTATLTVPVGLSGFSLD